MRCATDVNAAVVHALGLLCAHALHYMAMLGENRRHAIRTVGPKGGALGGALSVEADAVKGNVVWAVLQVLLCAIPPCMQLPNHPCVPSTALHGHL